MSECYQHWRTKRRKIWQKFHVRPSAKYDFHLFPHSQTRNCSTVLHRDFHYRISARWVSKDLKYVNEAFHFPDELLHKIWRKYKSNIEACSRKNFSRGKTNTYYIFRVSAYSFNFPRAKHVNPIVLSCHMFGSSIFFHISHNQSSFLIQTIEYKKVFWFSLLLSENFLTLRKIHR